MRKGKLTQAAFDRSVLRVLKGKREDVVQYPEYGCGYGAFRNGGEAGGTLTVTACGISAGFPGSAPEFAVYEACSHLLAAGAEPTGVTVQLLLPEEYSEPELKTLTATLDQAAGHYGAVILGGHTEVVPGLVKLVITVTAVGKAKSLPLKAEPELDLVVAGTIAGSAAARLAADQREQLMECFSEGFLNDTVKIGEERNLPEAVKIAAENGVCQMKAVSRGGIFGALWEMAEQAKVGLDVELKRIPIRQETIEICEYFSLNPYQMFCTDTLLAAAPDGAQLVRKFAGAQIPAAVIGRTTKGKERILRNGEEIRYLDKPQTDEWYAGEERRECQS